MLLPEFPNELLLQIASNLDRTDIFSLLLSNRRFANLLTSLHLAYACDSIKDFTTAVFCAAASNSEPCLRFLLNQNPFTNSSTGDRKDSPKCDIIIHTLCSPSSGAHRPDKLLFHRHPREFNTPLAIKTILVSAPKIIVQERCSGKTPLHYAADAGQEWKVRMLLRRGHNINVKDHDKDSALLCALKNKHDNIARLLIESGANIHAMARNGHTTFNLTVAWGHHEIVELMVRKGAKLEGRDRDGHTVLHDAAQNGDVEMVKLLLREGADVNAQVVDYYLQHRVKGWGDTPLHLAARGRHFMVVKVLLAHGADATIEGRDGSFANPIQIEDNWPGASARKST